MKKTYSTPELQTVILHTTPLLTTSNMTNGGTKTEDFTADSKEWQGSFLWDDTNYED